MGKNRFDKQERASLWLARSAQLQMCLAWEIYTADVTL